MTLLSTPSASPPKAPRSSFKSFEAITDPLCMIPFFKQWLSVCTLCFWNLNWSHKHNRLAISLCIEFCLWFVDLKNASLENIVAQSICTPLFYFIRSAWYFFRVWNFWKKVQNMGCKMQGAKIQGHCYSKREEAAWLLLFLNNNDPVFCKMLFATHIFDPFFHPAFCNLYFWPIF